MTHTWNKPENRKFPVLLAEKDTKGNTWRAWCPACRMYHHHSPEEGYRHAHCHRKDSPFQDTGYFLVWKSGANQRVHQNPHPIEHEA